jgi:hypothetical protein
MKKYISMKMFLLIMVACLVSFCATAQQLSISTKSTVSTCSSNGTITVSVTGGKAPYCYDLTPCSNCLTCVPATSNTFSSLAPGSYTVKVTDNSTPVQTQTATVVVTGTYTPLSILGEITTCGVVGHGKGGKKPYAFSISTDGTIFSATKSDSIFNALDPGTYYIRCTDACGNFTTYKATYTVPKFEFGAICSESGKKKDSLNIVLSAKGGVPGYQYQIVLGGKDSTAWSTKSVFDIKRTCATVKVKAKDACGRELIEYLSCLRLDTKVLCGNCNTGEYTLKVSGGTPPYNFYYFNGASLVANPNGLSNPFFKGLAPAAGSVNFTVTDSCGAIGIITYNCLSEDVVYILDKQKALVTPGGTYAATNPHPPYTITCETCVPKVSVKTDTSATFSVCGPHRFSITDNCGATMWKEASSNTLMGNVTSGCNFIKASTTITAKASAGISPPFPGIRPLYILYDSKGAFVDSNRTGNFNNLALGTYKVTISAPCWKPFEKVVMLSKDKLQLQLSMASGKDATGRCVPMWDVIATSGIGVGNTISGGPNNINLPLVPLFVDSTTLSQYNRVRVFPGKYTIKSSSVCLGDTMFTLPNIVIDPLKYVPPKCPSDPTIVLETLHDNNYWFSYWAGKGLKIPVINYDADYTTLDCIQGAAGCAKNSQGIYPNQVPGSSHTAYLYVGNDDGACPLDTLMFNFKPAVYINPDSLFIDYYLCVGSTSGSVTATIKNGAGPYTLQMLDAPNGKVLQEVKGDVKDLILNNVKPGDYYFLIIDACGNTKDSKKTIKQEVVITADVKGKNCSDVLDLTASKVPNAVYTWTNATTGAQIASGINLYSTTTSITSGQSAALVLSVKLKDCIIFEKTFNAVTSAKLGVKTMLVSKICAFDIVATGVDGTPPYTYKWSNGSTSSLLTNVQGSNLAVTVTDSKGCTAATLSTAQPGVVTPTVNLTADKLVVGQNDSIRIITLNSNQSLSSIVWTTSSGTITNISIPPSLTAKLTTYNTSVVTATVTSKDGCVGTGTIKITADPKITMPLAFYPGSTNMENAVFKPAIQVNVDVRRIVVYNRWGNVVHDAPTPWDGGDHPSDTYLYKVYYVTKGETAEQLIKGDVTLLR